MAKRIFKNDSTKRHYAKHYRDNELPEKRKVYPEQYISLFFLACLCVICCYLLIVSVKG